MTTDKRKFNKLLEEEMKLYGITKKNIKEKRFRHTKSYMLWKAVKSLRKYEFMCALRDKSKNPIIVHMKAFLVKLADRKMNKSFEKVDVELTPFMIGRNIRIYHDNVVVFGYVGDNCTFHGNNVVGNKRTGAHKEVPKIGSNVDIGYGAMIIGDVEIADNCVVGAGAVVTKSFTKEGSIIVGVPARAIEK